MRMRSLSKSRLRWSLALAALASALGPIPAFAADKGNDIRIVRLAPGAVSCETTASRAAFWRAIKQAGYEPAAVIEEHCFQRQADIPQIVARMIERNPTILVMVAEPVSVRSAKEATSKIPIVFYDMTDPVGEGLVTSLAHPGGNVTGISSIADDVQAKRIEIMRDAIPGLRRLALLGNLANTGQERNARVLQDAARALNIPAKLYDVRSPDDLANTFAVMSQDNMQAMVTLHDGWFFVHRAQLIALARQYALPALYASSTQAEQGGLFFYGANLPDMAVQAAGFVVKILKGAKPSDLPVEQPTQIDFVINAKTARELGLKLSPSFVLRASRVIE